MDKVLAKFKCDNVVLYENQETVYMSPVIKSDCKENQSFSKWTPAGKFEISVTNPDIYGFFRPGKEYYLEITQA